MSKTRSRRGPDRKPATKAVVAPADPPRASGMRPASPAQKWDIARVVQAAFPLILILVLGFALYLPSLAYPLENLDEPVIIGRNLPFLMDFSNVKVALRRYAFLITEKE